MAEEVEFYMFCQRRWESLKQKDAGYYPSRHDKVVFREAAERFGISEEEALEQFNWIDKKLVEHKTKNMTPEELTPEELKQALIKIVLENKESPYSK
jgi:hypothetical protein